MNMMRETLAKVNTLSQSLHYKDKKKVSIESALCEMIGHLLGPVAMGATRL